MSEKTSNLEERKVAALESIKWSLMFIVAALFAIAGVLFAS
tara:strand:+ start:976 stop:1098 length:123 start_codon:yes stop_codon:yes gene_type:complete